MAQPPHRSPRPSWPSCPRSSCGAPCWPKRSRPAKPTCPCS